MEDFCLSLGHSWKLKGSKLFLYLFVLLVMKHSIFFALYRVKGQMYLHQTASLISLTTKNELRSLHPN